MQITVKINALSTCSVPVVCHQHLAIAEFGENFHDGLHWGMVGHSDGTEINNVEKTDRIGIPQFRYWRRAVECEICRRILCDFRFVVRIFCLKQRQKMSISDYKQGSDRNNDRLWYKQWWIIVKQNVL